MVEVYNHQYLWDNRMERRVYDSFVDIWDREDLWVAIDRANLNPPRKEPGDLLIFNSLLPHGVRPNRSGDRFRAAARPSPRRGPGVLVQRRDEGGDRRVGA